MSAPRLCPGDEEGANAGGPCDFQPAIGDLAGDLSSDEEFVSRKSSKNAWKDDPDHPRHGHGRGPTPRWAKAIPLGPTFQPAQRNGSGAGRAAGNNNSNNNGRNNSNSSSSSNGSGRNGRNGRHNGRGNNGNNGGSNNNTTTNGRNGRNPNPDSSSSSNNNNASVNNEGTVPTTSNNNGNTRNNGSATTSPPAPSSAQPLQRQRRSELRCIYCNWLYVEPKSDKPYEFPAPDKGVVVFIKPWDELMDDDDDDDDC